MPNLFNLKVQQRAKILSIQGSMRVLIFGSKFLPCTVIRLYDLFAVKGDWNVSLIILSRP